MIRRKRKQPRALAEEGSASAAGGGRPSAQSPIQSRASRTQHKRGRRRRGPARQTRWMRVLGLVIATGGGVAIGFGWAGAASKGCVDCQIPYLLSGGAAGLALIVFGVSLLLLAQIRTESRRLGDRIEHALTRSRDGEAQAPRPAERKVEVSREAPADYLGGQTRPDDSPSGLADGVTVEAPPPTPNPLTAMPVDAPTVQEEVAASDGATLAATTAAGGVVDVEPEENETAAGEPATMAEIGETAQAETNDVASLASSPETTPPESRRRRRFLRRKQGP